MDEGSRPFVILPHLQELALFKNFCYKAVTILFTGQSSHLDTC